MSLPVRISPKTNTPIATAVTGSSAPRIAVGVDPIIFTAFTMNMSESTVATAVEERRRKEAVKEDRLWRVVLSIQIQRAKRVRSIAYCR